MYLCICVFIRICVFVFLCMYNVCIVCHSLVCTYMCSCFTHLFIHMSGNEFETPHLHPSFLTPCHQEEEEEEEEKE